MTVAILSWGAHQTLINTLESYKKYGLDQTDTDKIIFFQEISAEDIEIAQRYGYSYIGAETNIGIGPAYARLIQEAKGEFFLFLENDWELIEPDVDKRIKTAKYFLENEVIDVARFRHRKNPGSPLWTRQFVGRELTRTEHLLDSIHWRNNLEMEEFLPMIINYSNWFFTTARFANWTNNPTMFRTAWLKEHIMPYLLGDIERNIQSWWQTQDFGVAQGPGLFTHNRID